MQPLVQSRRPAAAHDTAAPVGGRARRAASAGMILLGGLFPTACDSFFGIRGQVADCAAGVPLAAVGIDVHVERGYRDRVESLPDEAMTDAKGKYEFDINYPSESWATLTFHHDGYVSLTPQQFQGHSQFDPPVNVCLSQAATP
jgi:hypothetical protein